MPPEPPAPQHLVGDPGGGFPGCWAEGHAESGRCCVCVCVGLLGLGGPMLCGIPTKYLGFQLFIVPKEKLEEGGVT